MADKADKLPCRLPAQATGTRDCGALAGYQVEPFGYAAFVLFGLPSRDEVRRFSCINRPQHLVQLLAKPPNLLTL